MVECSRVKYSEVEPSRAMVGCNRVEESPVLLSRAEVECSRVWLYFTLLDSTTLYHASA